MKGLVLAGGLPQGALIKELKSRNITTILADYNENPVARKDADVFYQVSTLDVAAITEVATKEEVDFLITVCTDQALLTVALVSETLGLPCYIDYQTALKVTNKSYMKKVFLENDIPTSPYVIMSDFDCKKLTHLKYPLIVKPVDCNSSKGVKKVFSEKELLAAFNVAKKASRTRNVIIEEFIRGTELSIDVYVESGEAKILAVSALDKVPAKDKFVILRSKCFALVEEKILNLIQITAQKIADAFGIQNSPMLIQLISDGEKVYVLEFSARTGGGEKFITIEMVSGFDVVKAVVDLTLGIKPHVVTTKKKTKYCISDFIYCYPGVFETAAGFAELKQEGIISEYMIFKWKGAEFSGIENSGDRVAGFIIQAETKEDLVLKHEIALSGIRILDNHGNDMARRDLLDKLVIEI